MLEPTRWNWNWNPMVSCLDWIRFRAGGEEEQFPFSLRYPAFKNTHTIVCKTHNLWIHAALTSSSRLCASKPKWTLKVITRCFCVSVFVQSSRDSLARVVVVKPGFNVRSKVKAGGRSFKPTSRPRICSEPQSVCLALIQRRTTVNMDWLHSVPQAST